MDKYKNADFLKLFFLSTRYSHPIDYNEEKIEASRKQKGGFDDFVAKVHSWKLREGKQETAASKIDFTKIDDICIKFEETMDDDFNTPQALACLFELIDLGSEFISLDKKEAFNYVEFKLETFFSVFGLKLAPGLVIPEEIQKKRRERDKAKENKEFKKADDIRKEMKKSGYLVSDTSLGTTIIYMPEEKEAES
jgi:cysteinyl-tRNA synthetase